MFDLNLQLFADGGDGGAGASPAGTPQEQGATGVKDDSAVVAALDELRQRSAKRGKPRIEYELPASAPQGEPVAEAKAQEIAGTPAAQRPSFDELISGEYKDEFGAKVQGIIQNRLKNAKGAEEALGKLQPALDALYKKHGVEAGDIEGLTAKITDDNSLYEQAAYEKGIPVEVEKEFQKVKQQAQMLEQQRRYADMERQFNQHLEGLAAQGEKLKETFPEFDLNTELQNPYFARLTSPEVRLSVEDAYMVIHKDEIIGSLMQYSVQQGQKQVADAVQAGANRPAENGLRSAGGAIQLSDDPKQWGADVIKQMAEEAKRGKKIRF